MTEDYTGTTNFPGGINKIVSIGGPDSKSITKLIKNGGEVVGYELSSGEHITVEQAINMVKENKLMHVGVSTSKDGSEYIRSLPDGDESNNLGNLPSITEDMH